MASVVFTVEHEEIINTNPVAKTIDFFRDILSAASSEDAMIHLKSLLYTLSASKPAGSITLPGSLSNLATKLRKFLKAWDEQVTLSTTLRPHLSLLLEKVASETSEPDIWATIVTLLKEFDRPTMIPTEDSAGTSAVALSGTTVESLKKDWTSTFIPDSLRVLEDVIQDFDKKKNKIDKFYARTLIFIQSSGMGKSRLADAFGQSCPMINYVFREKDTFGYPPADDEILSLMRMHPSDVQQRILTSSPNNSPKKKYPKSRIDTTWYHSLAVGLLQASFETLNAWVEEQSAQISPGNLATFIHKAMAHNSGSEEPLNHRPGQRIEFCQSVATRAQEIAGDLIKESSWRQVFDNEESSAIRLQLTDQKKNYLKGLLEAVQKLLDNLKRFRLSNAHHPPLVVVFDEASSLLKTEKSEKIHSGRYIALNRIMSCLKESCIWFFIISTESQVGTILPPNNAEQTGNYAEDPSLRFYDEYRTQLERISPFLAFRLDIQDRSTMEDSTRIQGELSKSLSDFGKPNHMAMFGRRLWFAYSDDPKGMNRVAKLKLIGGVQQGSYKPHNENHVFAALSFRLSLDPCMHNSKAIPLIRTAVNSFMRVVISMDEETGTMHTITPSEPILAKAAMEHLCTGLNWANSIDTLVRSLLDKGLVEKGLKGELYARLLLALTHDWVRFRQGQVSLDKSDREPHQEPESISGRTLNPEFSPEFMKSFTVKDFLEALYVKDCHKFINAVDSSILGARMNFTHFVPTHKNLYPEVLPDLLTDLLRRSAALQLAPCQPTYDILLPIYFGEENEPLDPSKCGCVMIQVKNRNDATTPEAIFQEEFTTVEIKKNRKDSGSVNTKKQKASNVPTKRKREKASDSSTSLKKAKVPIRNGPNFVFNEMTNPILFLLFDLGIIRTNKAAAPPVEVSYSSNVKNSPRVWAIHSRGHDDTVFHCLKLMNCVDSGNLFFNSTALGINAHDKLARRNELFYELRRDFRYSPVDDKGDVLPNKRPRGKRPRR